MRWSDDCQGSFLAEIRQGVAATCHKLCAPQSEAVDPRAVEAVHGAILECGRAVEAAIACLCRDDIDGFIERHQRLKQLVNPTEELFQTCDVHFARAARELGAQPTAGGLAWHSCHHALWAESLVLIFAVGIATTEDDHDGDTYESTPEGIRAHWQTLRSIVANDGVIDFRPAEMATELELREVLRNCSQTPVWDAKTGQLYFCGRVIRRIAGQARNIRLVLDAFEEQGWPSRIDDPLPGGRDSRRVNDTCSALQEGLSEISIRPDGTGTGFRWSVSE